MAETPPRIDKKKRKTSGTNPTNTAICIRVKNDHVFFRLENSLQLDPRHRSTKSEKINIFPGWKKKTWFESPAQELGPVQPPAGD